MIQEDYCSYEVSKLLNEKGLNGMCDTVIGRDGTKYDIKLYDYVEEETTPCPTHQMAMKWLRENKGLFINIGQSKCMNAPIKYRFSIWKDVTYIGKSGDTGDYSTYEEAIEAALKYCLTKVI